MIKVNQYMDILSLHKEGLSIRAIAERTGHSRNTVRKILRGEHDLKTKSTDRASKLDPFKDYLAARHAEFGLSAVRLIDEIKPMGYEGSVVTVRRFLAGLKAKQQHASRLTTRFETAPGHQAQVDWAYCGKHPGPDGVLVAIYAFVMVLGFSRMLFVRFTTSMKMEALFDCHRLAFEAFGGVPAEILYDNMKQVRDGPGKLNRQILDYAEHHGFSVKTHRPYRPRTKGKVERPVDYVKGNLLTGRTFEGLDGLNAFARHWLDHTANVRIHGTHGKRPVDLFAQEKPLLTPLEEVRPYRFVPVESRVVSYESMVQFQGSRYSVPPVYAGKNVEVAADGGRILVRLGDAVIADHGQAAEAGACVVQKEHLAELWELSRSQAPLPKDAPRWSVTFDQAVATTPLATFEEVAV